MQYVWKNRRIGHLKQTNQQYVHEEFDDNDRGQDSRINFFIISPSTEMKLND